MSKRFGPSQSGKPLIRCSGKSNAMLIRWLSRPAVITHRPRGTLFRASVGAILESMPRQPPVTPLAEVVGLMLAASNLAVVSFVCAKAVQYIEIIRPTNSLFIVLSCNACLVFRRLAHRINHQHLNRAFCRFE